MGKHREKHRKTKITKINSWKINPWRISTVVLLVILVGLIIFFNQGWQAQPDSCSHPACPLEETGETQEETVGTEQATGEQTKTGSEAGTGPEEKGTKVGEGEAGEPLELPPGYKTEVAGVDFSGLTSAQKTLALKVMNEENCGCGCGNLIAECGCGTATSSAEKVVTLAGEDKTEAEIKSALTTGSQPTPTPTETPTETEVSVDDDPSKGPEDAPVTIIEFADFQCPFCGKAEPTLEQVLENYGDQVRLVYRDYPLGFHQHAQKAAEAAECADEQGKFWEYHDLLFENQQALDTSSLKQYASQLGLDTAQFNQCLDSGKYQSEVQKDFEDGQAAGVTGTPAFFVNGQKITGAQPFSSFKQVIDPELE